MTWSLQLRMGKRYRFPGQIRRMILGWHGVVTVGVLGA